MTEEGRFLRLAEIHLRIPEAWMEGQTLSRAVDGRVAVETEKLYVERDGGSSSDSA